MPHMPSSRFNAYTWARDHHNAQLAPLNPVISEARQLFLCYEERYLLGSADEIENETMYQLFVHLVDRTGVHYLVVRSIGGLASLMHLSNLASPIICISKYNPHIKRSDHPCQNPKPRWVAHKPIGQVELKYSNSGHIFESYGRALRQRYPPNISQITNTKMWLHALADAHLKYTLGSFRRQSVATTPNELLPLESVSVAGSEASASDSEPGSVRASSVEV